MRTTVRELKHMIHRVIAEAGGNMPTKPQPYDGPMPPTGWSREQLTFLNSSDLDTVDDEGNETLLPPHLRDPMYDEEDCFGPVPPGDNAVYPEMDYFTTDVNPLPTRNIRAA